MHVITCQALPSKKAESEFILLVCQRFMCSIISIRFFIALKQRFCRKLLGRFLSGGPVEKSLHRLNIASGA